MAFTTTFALVSIVLVKLHIRIKHGTVSANLTEVCKPDSGIVDIALIGNQDNASSVSNIPHPTLQWKKALACILNQGMVYQQLRKHIAHSHSLKFVGCKMMVTLCRRKL